MVTISEVIPDRSVVEVVGRWAHSAPENKALLDPCRAPITYGDLADRLTTVVRALERFGVRKSHRVAMALPDSADAALLFLAVVEVATCCPVNPVLTERELDDYFAAIRPACVLVQRGLSGGVRAAAQRTGALVIDVCPRRSDEVGSFTLSATGGSVASPWAADSTALILPTSGTTAGAKLVPIDTSTMLAGAFASASAYELSPGDCRLNVMPLFHVQGLVGSVLASLVAGSAVLCCPTFDPNLTLRWIDDHEVSWLSGSPTMHRALLDAARSTGRPQGTALRFLRAGSAPLPASLMAELEDFWGIPVIESYGMTEAHQIASSPLPPRLRKSGTVGVPTGAEVRIIDEKGDPVERGHVGEILVRGPNVIRRYLASEEVNHASFLEGWLRTGDIGYLDDDGYLTLTDRLKEMIIRGGEKISPREVDAALAAHPAVARAVAFGYPHPSLTQEVGAAIVVEPGLSITEGALQRFAAERLARFKVPKRIFQVENVPVGTTGKIHRNKLAEELGLMSEELSEISPPQPSPSQGRRANGAVEAALAGIWAQALSRDFVALDDDFFELGGDSLTGIVLLGMVLDVLGEDIGAVMLYEEANTVARMAAVIQRSRTERMHVQRA